INLSKLYLNSPGKLTLVSFFETKNQIEKRITMIKRFRKNNYKITAAAIVCVIVASAFTLTIALSPDSAEKEKVHQMDTQDTAAIVTPKEQPQKEESKFLIDDAVKVYSDIKKVEQVAGFKFKVPAYMPVGYKADGFQLLKASKEANVLKVFYRTENNKKRSFSYEFLTSTINLSKFLPENARNQFIGEADKINVDIESNSTAFDIGALKGSKLTIKQVFKGPKPLEIVSTYFVWQDKETECAIKYNETIKNSSGTTTIWLDLPQKDVERIALSIQYPDEKLENSIYKGLSPEVSTEIAQLPIYDKEDLQKAKGMLGFNLKFPINIPGDFKATMAHVGITANSDIKNKKILYELNMVYRNGKSFIAFTQRKDGAVYDEAARNGTIVFKNGGPNSPQMIKVESLKGYEKAVFRYELRPEVIVYTWKEDGFYCEVSFIDCQDNVEDALKSIIDEKPYKLD
ncbi:MAG: hypothetical protein N2484_07730, partial [Clostridia bacterium]|nr:hypothetical protein [Clostridia bacterium]